MINFKKFTSQDLKLVEDFYANTSMMKYIGDGKIYSEKECIEALPKIIKRYKTGTHHGHWAVFDDAKYIGKALLLPWDNSIDFELGYGVFPEYWGRGYGFLIAQHMLNLAIEDGHKNLVATVHRKNKASIKILKKLGFKYKKIAKKYGRRKDLYEWKKS